MKKISTLLVSVFMVVAAFAVEPVYITPVYEHSIMNGNKPAWMDGVSERSIAYYEGKLYVPSVSNGNQIYVINPSSGEKIDTIALPAEAVYGGDVEVCGIQITASGKILVANCVVSSKVDNFKIYSVTPKVGEAGYDVTTVIDWLNPTTETTPVYRCGDSFAIYGDLTAGSNGYIMTANTNDLSVYRWDITNGVVAASPVIFKLLDQFPAQALLKDKKIHFGPVIYPVDATHFILNSARMHPTLYDMSGAIVNTFNGPAQPGMAGISGLTHFNFKGRSFIVCGSTSHQTANNPLPLNTFEAFEINGGEFNFTGASSIAGRLPSAGFGGSATDSPNGTYLFPMAYNVLDNAVDFWVMVPNVALSYYKLTIGAPAAVENAKVDDITVYPVPATDVVNFSTSMTSIELYDLAGQVVRKAQNANQLTVSGLQGAYIVKAISAQGQVINKKVTIQ